MRVVSSFLLAFLLCCMASAQLATFTTDAKYLYHGARTHEDSLKKLEREKTQEWLLHGHRFSWAEKTTLRFTPDPHVMDTIFFHQSDRHDWDTLLMNVKRPGNFKFVYNECCSGFYLVNEASKKFTEASVRFTVVGGGFYVAMVNSEAVLLRSGESLLLDEIPRGAMDPNVVRVTIYQLEGQPAGLASKVRFMGGLDLDGSFEVAGRRFKVKRTVCNFLYADVHGEPLEVKWDGVRLWVE